MTTITDAIATAWNDIATHYSAARRALAASKKASGKKSAETKAARKVVRAIKKERAAFMAANPGFVAPPKPSRKKTRGMQYTPPAPKVDNTTGETVYVFRAGKWYKPDGKTLDEKMNAEMNAAAGAPGAPREFVVDKASEMDQAAVVANMSVGKSAPAAEAPVAKVSVTALLLKALADGNSGSPSQLAAWVTTAEAKVTAKQAGDALARLAKTGKVVKGEDGKYTAK